MSIMLCFHQTYIFPGVSPLARLYEQFSPFDSLIFMKMFGLVPVLKNDACPINEKLLNMARKPPQTAVSSLTSRDYNAMYLNHFKV
jgi:hypothetical protein